MGALDDLKVAIADLQGLAKQLSTAAEQSKQSEEEARHALAVANQKFLKAIAPRLRLTDGVLDRDPAWNRASEAELDVLRNTKRLRGTEYKKVEKSRKRPFQQPMMRRTSSPC